MNMDESKFKIRDKWCGVECNVVIIRVYWEMIKLLFVANGISFSVTISECHYIFWCFIKHNEIFTMQKQIYYFERL